MFAWHGVVAGAGWWCTLFLGGGNSNICGIFIPKFGEDEPKLTSIFFEMGWFNHQPVKDEMK